MCGISECTRHTAVRMTSYIAHPDDDLSEAFLKALGPALKDGQMAELEKLQSTVQGWPEWAEKATNDATDDQMPYGHIRKVREFLVSSNAKKRKSPSVERQEARKERIAREGGEPDSDDMDLDKQPPRKLLLPKRSQVGKGKGKEGANGKSSKGKGKSGKSYAGEKGSKGKGKGKPTFGTEMHHDALPMAEADFSGVQDEETRRALKAVQYGAMASAYAARTGVNLAKELAEAQPIAILFVRSTAVDHRTYQQALDWVQQLPQEPDHRELDKAIAFDRRTGLSLRWALKYSANQDTLMIPHAVHDSMAKAK